MLVSRMMKQRGKINRLSLTLNNLFGRRFDAFYKYNKTSPEFDEGFVD